MYLQILSQLKLGHWQSKYIPPWDVADYFSLCKVRQQVDTLVVKLRYETHI
jgi:hypothetical protein